MNENLKIENVTIAGVCIASCHYEAAHAVLYIKLWVVPKGSTEDQAEAFLCALFAMFKNYKIHGTAYLNIDSPPRGQASLFPNY